MAPDPDAGPGIIITLSLMTGRRRRVEAGMKTKFGAMIRRNQFMEIAPRQLTSALSTDRQLYGVVFVGLMKHAACALDRVPSSVLGWGLNSRTLLRSVEKYNSWCVKSNECRGSWCTTQPDVDRSVMTGRWFHPEQSYPTQLVESCRTLACQKRVRARNVPQVVNAERMLMSRA